MRCTGGNTVSGLWILLPCASSSQPCARYGSCLFWLLTLRLTDCTPPSKITRVRSSAIAACAVGDSAPASNDVVASRPMALRLLIIKNSLIQCSSPPAPALNARHGSSKLAVSISAGSGVGMCTSHCSVPFQRTVIRSPALMPLR